MPSFPSRLDAATDPRALALPTDADRNAYASALPGRLEVAIAFVKQNQIQANEWSKRFYDRFRSGVTFGAIWFWRCFEFGAVCLFGTV